MTNQRSKLKAIVCSHSLLPQSSSCPIASPELTPQRCFLESVGVWSRWPGLRAGRPTLHGAQARWALFHLVSTAVLGGGCHLLLRLVSQKKLKLRANEVNSPVITEPESRGVRIQNQPPTCSAPRAILQFNSGHYICSLLVCLVLSCAFFPR